MKYVSLFSGIEAATLAWELLGWECVAFAEVAPFPSAVLAERWPGVPNLGDITQVDWSAYRGSVDLIVGGSPCQSFSVAGLRRGLDDPRGNLALEFLRAVDAVHPRWVVWENVPGVFSAVSHECPDPCPPPPPLDLGRDGAEVDTEDDYDAEEVHAFLTFLAALRQLGYGFSYRVLDAQYVRVESHPRAVPQRRRRVFVVGHSGELGRPSDEGEVQDAQRAWTLPAAVLVERESLSWHPAPRRTQGAGVTPTAAGGAGERGSRVDAETAAGGVCSLTANGVGTCGADDNQAQAGHLVPEVADPISASEGKTYSHEGAHNFQLHNVVSVAENQRGEIVTGDVSHAVSSGGSKPGSGYPCVAHALTSEGHDASAEIVSEGSPSLTTSHDGPPICMAPSFSKRPGQQIATRDDGSSFAVTTGEPPRLAGAEMAVRRLTPRECERLQGMPDDHTLIEWKGKPAPDGKRYAAIGNSMAVNVMRFIGERIAVVEGLSI
jgi:DNA (cytosine-5)-methyltransferase 1